MADGKLKLRYYVLNTHGGDQNKHYAAVRPRDWLAIQEHFRDAPKNVRGFVPVKAICIGINRSNGIILIKPS